jgi:hypothetical protein
MVQQTAVEWLHIELTKTWYDDKSSQNLLEQAKQMEKEQMKEHYTLGVKSGWEAHECKTKD